MEAIKSPNASQNVVGPIASGSGRREPKAVRQQLGVLRDLLARVEVLRQQSRRHDQRVSRVCKTLSRRAVGRKLTRMTQIEPGQVADRVGVLCVVWPPQHYSSLI